MFEVYNTYTPGHSALVNAVRQTLEHEAELPPKKKSGGPFGTTPQYVIVRGEWRKMFIVAGTYSVEKHQRLGQVIRPATQEEIRIWNALMVQK